MSVINDLVTDNRVQRTCSVLGDLGYDVTLIGRRLAHSPPVPRWNFQTVRMRLLFTSGPIFYLSFNLRLLLQLLWRKSDLLYANDLDTLLPNYIVSRVKGVPLIYDSHELFCDVPELAGSPFKRRIWLRLEGWLVPKLKHCITVNGSIARIFEEKYGRPFSVVRNMAAFSHPERVKTREELGLPANRRILLLQGAGINIDRGAEELISAMKLVPDGFLVIVGSGDVWPVLQKQSAGMTNVKLVNRLPPEELRHYTLNADIGVSIDKNTNPNYYNSLPNKLFDYLNAGLPVLASRLPEVERVLDEAGCGIFISSHEPEHIAMVIHQAIHADLSVLKANAVRASKRFSWENEREVLRSVILRAGEAQ